MNEPRQEPLKSNRLRTVTAALEEGTLHQVRKQLNDLHSAEIAHLLESLPPNRREIIWELIDSELDGEVLLHVNDEVRNSLILRMDTEELVAATEGMDTDDLADFLQILPETVTQEILQSMDNQDRQRIEAVMSYPEHSAGGLMDTDMITVRPSLNVDVVMRYLRLLGKIPQHTDKLIMVDRKDQYLGVINLTDLLTSEPGKSINELLIQDYRPIPAEMPSDQVAHIFRDYDLVSAPVINERGQLIGRITIDDVVDVITEEAEHNYLSRVGLGEEDDMFAPILISTKRRAIWLGLNLVTAFLASFVIGFFEGTLEKVVALAVLMPIVASMGGIAGSQTLTLVIRGLAVGQISFGNTKPLLIKEISVAAINGMIWAIVVAIVAFIWFRDIYIGIIIGLAIIINLIMGAISGLTIPLLLRRFGIDPALAGGVVLTTVTDIIGFLAFLGLATLIFL